MLFTFGFVNNVMFAHNGQTQAFDLVTNLT